MSWWGSIEANFTARDEDDAKNIAACIAREIEEREPGAPTGSERGPLVMQSGNGIAVEGNLRDVDDAQDSPLVLAWFMQHARWLDEAYLMWDLGSTGPRYRWEWRNGELIKLKGVLD